MKFVERLAKIVNDCICMGIGGWSLDGNIFIVYDHDAFQTFIKPYSLPTLKRQLNYYGFSVKFPSRGFNLSFSHAEFIRSNYGSDIKRNGGIRYDVGKYRIRSKPRSRPKPKPGSNSKPKKESKIQDNKPQKHQDPDLESNECIDENDIQNLFNMAIQSPILSPIQFPAYLSFIQLDKLINSMYE
jgi:hypothetical protein